MSGDVNIWSVWMLSVFHVKPTHVNRGSPYTSVYFRIPERTETPYTSVYRALYRTRESQYTKLYVKKSTRIPKRTAPYTNRYTKRKMSRIPSVYRAQVIARRGHIPIVYQLMVYHHLCHSVLFAGFGNSSKQNVLEAMVCKAIWYEAPNDLPLSFEHVLLERMIRF